MRNSLAIIVALGVLASLPARGETGLTLFCTTRDLPPGSQVWIEVEPQYQPQVAAGPDGGFRDSAPPQAAQTKHVWSFEVPASGVVAPASHHFNFPAGKNGTNFGSIYLKTRFKIDDPRGTRRPGYGDVTEVTLGMPVPDGATRLTRCLRLRDEGDRLTVETAADCLDETFEKARRSGNRVRMKAPGR